MSPACGTLALACFLLLAGSSRVSAWKKGRATFYGNEPWYWSIHHGSEHIDRNGACRDTSKSVIVQTTDTCPCNYPNNYFSNKRWCCGDMDHLDVSVWAFQKLTDMKYGVIPIQYRRVDCGQQPANKAYLNYDQMFPGEFPPKSQASSRGDFDWYKYFPNGGYMNSKSGDGSDKLLFCQQGLMHATSNFMIWIIMQRLIRCQFVGYHASQQL
ncbi:RlpA-like double-psi beta-barrel-protein domain-containing protein-containing protein [Scenedesmus sp. NREL 46B-D3]|nr:RlpA-like double-psi beta-barrel-protein domain-containing protein-containing protein [Scenedesmus sp. NREL 46B-D3]